MKLVLLASSMIVPFLSHCMEGNGIPPEQQRKVAEVLTRIVEEEGGLEMYGGTEREREKRLRNERIINIRQIYTKHSLSPHQYISVIIIIVIIIIIIIIMIITNNNNTLNKQDRHSGINPMYIISMTSIQSLINETHIMNYQCTV